MRLLPLAALPPCGCGQAPPAEPTAPPSGGWREHVSEKGAFRDSYPGEPALQEVARALPPVTTATFGPGMENPQVFTVRFRDLTPAETAPAAPEREERVAVGHPGAKVEGRGDTSLGGHPGRRVELSMSGCTRLDLRVVVVGSRVCPVSSLHQGTPEQRADAARFFESFAVEGSR